MVSTIAHLGCEDIDFDFVGAPLSSAALGNTATGFWCDATANRFRAGWARYGLACQSGNTSDFARAICKTVLGNLASFYFSARVWNSVAGNPNGLVSYPLRFYDSNLVTRIRIKNTSTNSQGLHGPFVIEKVSAAGAATTLGTFTTGTGFAASPGAPQKLDVFMNYGTSGQIIVKIDRSVVCDTGIVDTTTDGNTSLDRFAIGPVTSNNGSFTAVNSVWSEIAIDTAQDLTDAGVVTQTGLANGNTHNFTTGAASNISANLTSYTAVDTSAVAGQIDEYTITPTLPGGGFSVRGIVQKAMVAAGNGGPQHAQLLVRVGGTDYPSGTLTPGANVWTLLANTLDVNPNTGSVWLASDIVNASTLYNIGIQSVT